MPVSAIQPPNQTAEEVKLFDVVLLLEDDMSHAFIIKRALSRYARDIRHVQRLAEARDAIAREHHDLVVSDLHLPDASGVAEIAALAAERPNVPMIVLTSSSSLKHAVEAMQSGARDYIVKDFGADFHEVLGLSLARVSASLRLEEEKRRFEHEKEILKVAIENSSDGLAVVERSGLVQWANASFRSFARRCGGDENHLLEMFSPAVSKHAELAVSVRQHVEELAGGGVWHTEVTFVNDVNTAYDLSLSIADPRAGGKECVVWVRDMSEVRRRERFQREIISTTSHDLKGPLGAVVLSSELLKEMAEQGSRVYEIALRIGSSAQGALNLIEEFLSARRLRDGNFIMKPVHLRLDEVVKQVANNYDAIAAARKITFHVDLQSDGRAYVDRLGFERVLGNLLNNAFKFTPREGRVDVRVAVSAEGELHMEVRDTGSGMEPSEVHKIFRRFTRLDRHSDIAGSGLGLFVVKSIVQAHGGGIEVISKVGEGTAFRLTFPAHPPVNEHGELISLDFA